MQISVEYKNCIWIAKSDVFSGSGFSGSGSSIKEAIGDLIWNISNGNNPEIQLLIYPEIRLNRPVITVEMASKMDCPFPESESDRDL